MNKNLLIIWLIFCISLMLTACGSKSGNSEMTSEPGNHAAESVTSSEASGEPAESTVPSKSLVVYFSWSGNTRRVAEAIQQQTGSDMFELIPVTPYSDDYNTVLDEAKTEQQNNARPEITGGIENMAEYDTIYVGFPNWWGDMPMILYSFFDSYDLSGKTVALFCTSGGSGLSGSVDDVKALEPEAMVTAGLHIGSGASAAPEKAVAQWLEEIGTIKEEPELSIPDEFILIPGGSFQMGSPADEAWRSEDETQHSVTVSDFYMSRYELTQKEYAELMGENPSNFSGDTLPVENISWLDAALYCNARSEAEGLQPVYTISEQSVVWDRSANGYRLPTEAEWEYACRAGTTTPFYIVESPGAGQANYYGHYPYGIEDNYFSQRNLTVQPGEYRQTTLPVGSFEANPYGLFDMHGNVGEWVWDYYGAYPSDAQTDPTGAASGALRVYRGGGWNDFAKNMRSAYRAAMEQNKASFNLGLRLVRNAVAGSGSISADAAPITGGSGSRVLIAYFSWGGNTRGVAEEIARQTGADLFEITTAEPYSTNYNTVLDQAQADQSIQARPALANHVDNMEQYDTVLLGYPNWWASIPMPVASFLEEYDFSGKTIIPFCSHGGGRFGQSLTAIAKLAPDAVMGEALSIHYSGGSSLASDIRSWLEDNQIPTE